MSALQRTHPLYDLPLEQRHIGRFLSLRAQQDGARPYLTIGGRTYTFAQTDERCRNLARGLSKRGIKDASRVLVLLPNCAEFIFTWYACSLLGAAIVPLNPQLKGPMLEALFEDAAAEAAIVHHTLLQAIDSMRAEISNRLPWWAVVGGVDGVERVLQPERCVDFDALYTNGGADVEVTPDYRRIQVISYTSGTTGPAKGVMIPDGQSFSSACTYMRLTGMTREDIVYSPLPLFHGLASRMCALPALVLGAHAVIDERFSASAYWEQAARCNATLAQVVHAIVALIMAQPPGAFDRAHKVRAVFNAAHDLLAEQQDQEPEQ
ncbi:MAG: AMP-binding protein, partial [Pseudomonadota bacterium]